jgi:outer membrane protein OmpA-like peptidoglycan-associated protein
MNFWTVFFSITLGFWTLAGSYWFTCDCQQLCDGWRQSASATGDLGNAPADQERLAVQYQGSELMSAERDMTFQPGSQEVAVPSASFFLLDSLRRHLAANPGQKLRVVGYYAPTEPAPQNFANLGVARANAFANILYPDGSGRDRLELVGESRPSLAKARASFNGGIALTVVDGAVAETGKVAEPPKKSTFNKEDMQVLNASQIVHFQPGSSNMIKTPEQAAYFKLLKDYLATYPNSSITLTGHTDNQGNPARNQQLGQRRAEAVQAQLVKELGIKPAQVKISSLGDTQPLADNATPNGRYQNRRVEINFQNKPQ